MTANLTTDTDTDSTTYPHYRRAVDPRSLRTTGNSRDIGDIRETRPELVASVIEHGVDPTISVINVAPDPDGVLRVIVGFSRTAAAATVRDNERPDLTVGVLVHEPGTQRDRLIAQGIENIHRQGYTRIEEINLLHQLAFEGLDAEATATTMSLPLDQVRAGRTIAANPRTYAAVAALPEPDMFAAAQLAEFEDHEKFHQQLVEVLATRPRDFDLTVVQLRRKRRQQAAQLAEEERLSELGYTLVADEYDPPEGAVALEDLCGDDELASLDPARHTTCPGRAAHVYVDLELEVESTEFCTDYAAHGHRSLAEVAVAAAERDLRAQGVRIVDPELDTAAQLCHLFADDDAERTLRAEEHASCPGHGAYVDHDAHSTTADVHFVCEDYAAHGHLRRAAAPTADTERDSAYRAGELKRAWTNNTAWRDAKVRRREWLAATYFAGWRKQKAAALPARVQHWLALAPVLASDYLAEAAPAHRYACGLLGLDEPKSSRREENPIAVLLRKKNTTELHAVLIRLALVVGACEEHWDRAYTDKNADSSWRKPNADSRFYFELLAALDYTLEPVETLINDPGADAENWPHLAATASDQTP